MRFHSALIRSPLTRTGTPRVVPTKALVRVPYVGQQRAAMNNSAMMGKMKESMTTNPVAWWLFGCAGLVATTLTVGAAARLTRVGASMLYWVPNGPFPPTSDDEWRHEYEAYSDFLQRHQRRPMSFDEFKRNFKYEYLHRLLGEGTTLAFLGPLGYFYMKEKLPTSIHGLLAGVLALGATQMYIGRQMAQTQVKSSHRHHADEQPPFEAPHGLTYHSAFSMANMALLLWAGFHLVSPPARAVKLRELTMSHALKDIGELRKYMLYVTALFAGTAAAGTMVASLDAGKAYNTFPKMNGQWIPDGIFEKTPWWSNFSENVALVQLDHRVLAVGTLGAYAFIYMKARKPQVWDNLPPETKSALHWTLLAVGGQAAGGVTMLVNAVPTTLAMVHQSGAAAILGTSLWTLYTLRFARPMTILNTAKTMAKAM